MWRRYVVDIFQFGRFFLAQWVRQAGGRKFEPLTLPEKAANGTPASAPLRLSGALTVANRENFQKQIEIALAQTPSLSLDLSGVTFMDSASLGALVALSKAARAAGGDLVLTHLQPNVRRSIELLRLDRFFNLGEAPEPHTEALGVASPAGAWKVYRMPPRLEVTNAQAIRAALESEVAASPRLIADFHQTEFLDSSGIAVMLATHRQAASKGGELRQAGLGRDLRRTLELAGMHHVFHLYENLESASQTPFSPPPTERSSP